MDKQIQINFIKSVGIINKNIFLVAILSALLIFDISKPSLGLMMLQLFAYALIQPLIYGRFYENASGETTSSWPQLFKKHWLNYTLVMFVFAIPFMAINQFDLDNKFAATSTLSVVIQIITIYVMPLVFITRKRIFSITSGIKCLIENVQYSIPFIVIALFMAITTYLTQSYILNPLQNQTAAFYPASFLWGMIVNYISIAVFTTVTMMLLENENLKKYLTTEN
jgi:hypothetical protein